MSVAASTNGKHAFDPEEFRLAVPAELFDHQQWVGAVVKPKGDGKSDKLPINPRTGRAASTNDPSTWDWYDQVVECIKEGHAERPSFVASPSDPFTLVDFDDCVNPVTREITDPVVKDRVTRLDTYTEYSQSGTGLHLIGKGKLPLFGRKKGNVEMYDQERHFVMSGDHVPGTPTTINDFQDSLDAIHAEVWPPAPARKLAEPIQLIEFGDDALLNKAFEAANGAELEALWRGNISAYIDPDTGEPDDSRADMALVSKLAFWTGPNPDRIERLARQSALARPKWDTSRRGTSYIRYTIDNVLRTKTDFYKPKKVVGDDDDGGLRAMLEAQAEPELAAEPMTLAEVLNVFRKWLHLPDTGLVEVTAGAVAANLMVGDPVWLLAVSGPSSGKTEILQSINRLPNVHLASVLTEGALLSGTPKREKDKSAKGGLLREIGAFGHLLCKDFTSVLGMKYEARTAMLSALREIYDGSWTRHVGVDGGRTLSWSGKIGLVAGVTGAIDSHHAVMSLMGERFLLYRQADPDEAQARRALEHIGDEPTMRAELAAAMAGLFAGLKMPDHAEVLTESERDRLVALAGLAARARSGIERDGHTREIILIPPPEAPARLALSLARLYAGLRAVGVEYDRAWQLVIKVAFDSVPALRRNLVDQLAKVSNADSTTLALAVHHPTVVTRRALEDLTAHGVVERFTAGAGKADLWALSDWAARNYRAAGRTLSENSPNIKSDGALDGALSLSPDTPLTYQEEFSDKPTLERAPISDEGSRVNVCWKCKAEVASDSDVTCGRCGWITCPQCFSCKEGCEGVLADGQVRAEPCDTCKALGRYMHKDCEEAAVMLAMGESP